MISPPGVQPFALAAQVAAALMDSAPGADDVAAPPLGGLAAAPHFLGPLRLARARARGVSNIPLDADFIRRLAERPETRLCALLAGQPAAAARAAAMRVAAAILHRGLIGVVLKSDRDRMRAALGEDAFAIATQEAALLDAPLVQLGAGEPMVGAADLDGLPGRLAALGGAALARFASLAEPGLAGAVARRFPDAADAGILEAVAERHCASVVKLLRRRGPGWATLIS